jgi:predicted negative regulator of RcsB-dependent stress response
MASTVEPTLTAPPTDTAAEPAVLVWFEKNRKVIIYGVAAIAVVAVGSWLFLETGKRKAAAASDALDRARAAFETGNLPTAASEFQRVTENYGGTDAGYQAELAMNEVRLASGQTQLAVDQLRQFAAKSPPPFYASGAYALMGGALENLKKYDEAATAYSKSAEIATEAFRQVDALLGAARAHRLAGKEAVALGILRGVVSKYPKDTPGVAEAEVRLAELTKGAM